MDTAVTAGAGLEEYLEPEEAARIIRCSKHKLAVMRMDGSGPPFAKVGHRTVLYRRSDIDGWIAERLRVRTTPIDLDELSLDEPGPGPIRLKGIG